MIDGIIRFFGTVLILVGINFLGDKKESKRLFGAICGLSGSFFWFLHGFIVGDYYLVFLNLIFCLIYLKHIKNRKS